MGDIVVNVDGPLAAGALSALAALPLDRDPPTRVVVVDGHGSGLTAAAEEARARSWRVVVVALDELGDEALDVAGRLADEVVEWGCDEPAATVAALTARLERWHQIDGLVRSPAVGDTALGRAPAFLDALAEVVELAVHSEAPVLVTGETGTGKEIAARLLHALGPRAGAPFVVVDCTTIVATLSGSELFGHERGAFTGAHAMRTGALAAADGGTLFLDEVGELPLPIQAELLRAVQEGAYKRVGGDRWFRSRFRLVSATNRNLEEEVVAGRFRQDLFHRIAGASVVMPPLRDRPGDIEPLFRAFVEAAHPDHGAPALSPAVRRLLLARRYPGNLRDLRPLATWVAARHTGPGPVTVGDLPRSDRTLLAPPASPSPSGPAPAHHGADNGAVDGVVDGVVDRVAEVPTPDDSAVVRALVVELLTRGLGLRAMTRLITDVAVDVALERAGSTRAAAALLGITERAVQLRRRALRPADP